MNRFTFREVLYSPIAAVYRNFVLFIMTVNFVAYNIQKVYAIYFIQLEITFSSYNLNSETDEWPYSEVNRRSADRPLLKALHPFINPFSQPLDSRIILWQFSSISLQHLRLLIVLEDFQQKKGGRQVVQFI